jgi:hypothetical protein
MAPEPLSIQMMRKRLVEEQFLTGQMQQFELENAKRKKELEELQLAEEERKKILAGTADFMLILTYASGMPSKELHQIIDDNGAKTINSYLASNEKLKVLSNIFQLDSNKSLSKQNENPLDKLFALLAEPRNDSNQRQQIDKALDKILRDLRLAAFFLSPFLKEMKELKTILKNLKIDKNSKEPLANNKEFMMLLQFALKAAYQRNLLSPSIKKMLKDSYVILDPKLQASFFKGLDPETQKLFFKDLDLQSQKSILAALDSVTQARLFATLDKGTQKELFEILDAKSQALLFTSLEKDLQKELLSQLNPETIKQFSFELDATTKANIAEYGFDPTSGQQVTTVETDPVDAVGTIKKEIQAESGAPAKEEAVEHKTLTPFSMRPEPPK